MTAAELRDAERLIDLLRPRLETRRTRRYELHPHGRRAGAAGDVPAQPGHRRRPRRLGLAAPGPASPDDRRPLRRLAARWSATPGSSSGSRRRCRARRASGPRRSSSGRGSPGSPASCATATPTCAIDRVSETVTDWSGGTRIGESFRRSTCAGRGGCCAAAGSSSSSRTAGIAATRRSSARETARLQRNCHRLIWLNPLAGDDRATSRWPRGWRRPIRSSTTSCRSTTWPRSSASARCSVAWALGRRGRPPRTGVPHVYRVEPLGSGRRSVTAVAPRVFGLPSRAGGAWADPAAARRLGGRA